MLRCAFCLREIEDAKRAWKGREEHFFCSEFCADMESTEFLFRSQESSAEPDPHGR